MIIFPDDLLFSEMFSVSSAGGECGRCREWRSRWAQIGEESADLPAY